MQAELTEIEEETVRRNIQDNIVDLADAWSKLPVEFTTP